MDCVKLHKCNFMQISPYGAGGLTTSEISSLGGGSRIGVGGLSGGVGPGGGSS